MAARYALAAILNAAIANAQFYTDSDYSYDDSTTSSTSVYWTATTRFVEQLTTSYYTYTDYSSVDTETYTTTRAIKDDVTPTATPTFVSTTYAGYYSDDVELVYAYYPIGAAAESDLQPDYYAMLSSTSSGIPTSTSIDFSMPVTMTAPASCPTPFTVTTSASVSIPSLVTDQVTPTSTETGSTTKYGGTIYEYQTWWLSASAAPFASSSDIYYANYIASCSTPPAAYRTGTTSSNNDDDSSSSSSCYYSYYSYSCSSPMRTWIIVIACLIPGLFFLGFLESWFWFRRLMMGKSAMRFGTVCWVLISLWVLCFTRMQDRRSADDQKLLAEKWKNMGSGAAFKAWWKWGFRHRYPEELLGQFSKTTAGIVPPGQPLYPAMAQTPGAFQPGAPGGGGLQPVPGAHGQVYYYGPPPPGWVQAPNGGFVPPQGYMYPPAQQAGYYGDMSKDGSVVSHSPVSALGHPAHQQPMSNVSPMSPQAPQPVYPAPQNGTHVPTAYGAPPNMGQSPSPPPQGPVPTPPPQAAAQGAPQIPPLNMSEVSAEEAPRQAPTTGAAR